MTDELKTPMTAEQVAEATGGRVLTDEEGQQAVPVEKTGVLAVTTQTTKADVINDIKRFSGEYVQNPRPMCITFDANSGYFSREIDETDEETGKNKWEEIDTSIKFQVLTTTNNYKPEFNSQDKFYSDEFRGGLITLYGREREIVWQGSAKELKNDPIKDTVTFVQNVYVWAKIGAEPATIYKLRLSGSNLTTWFPYLQSFGSKDSATCYVTVASRGKRMKNLGAGQPSVDATPAEIESYDKNIQEGRGDRNKIKLYYLISFTKGEEFPLNIVSERLGYAQEYIAAKELNKKEKDVVSTPYNPSQIEAPVQATEAPVQSTAKEEAKEVEEAEIDVGPGIPF